MNAMSKQKRQKVLLVAIVTALVLVGLWFGLLNVQRQVLEKQAQNIAAMQVKLTTARKALSAGKQLEAERSDAAQKLNALEEEMASGDLYAWLRNLVREFKNPYRVEIPQFSSIVEEETTLLPQFPYRQVRVTIGGTGFFHDIGKFVSDFENQFPHTRIQNLELEPAPALAEAEKEMLSFRMDIVALIRDSAVPAPGKRTGGT